jgi:hypothetical protein
MHSNPIVPTTLRGRWLILARAIWFAVVILATGMLAMGLLALADSLRAPPPEAARLLRQLGLSTNIYVGYVVAYHALSGLAYLAIAGLVFWRKSNDWLAIFVSLAILSIGLTEQTDFGDPLVSRYSLWYWPVNGLQTFGHAAVLSSFYLFPDGHFTPRWMRFLAAVWVGLLLIWLFNPAAPFNPIFGNTWEQTPLASLLVILLWYSSGVLAQIYRYRRVSSPVQQQQTKWVVWGFTISVLGVLVRYGPLAALSTLQPPLVWNLYNDLVGLPLGGLFMAAAPATIGLAILRFRLWEIDPLIKLTLVYTILTGSLAMVYLVSVGLFQWFVLNFVSVETSLTGPAFGVIFLLSSLLVAALFQPLHRRLQEVIDRRFYREKVDFRQAFTEFSQEVRLIIDLPDLLRALVTRVTELLHITHGAVFLRHDDGSFHLAESRRLPPGQPDHFLLDSNLDARLQRGEAVSQPQDRLFPLLLPLTAPKAGSITLVGVLTLGPRRSEQPYSQADQTLLLSLADQAGTAIAVAQLVESERQLEAYRASPSGRAEVVARDFVAQPEMALFRLHDLTRRAGPEADAASLLSNLPQALNHLQAGPLARLAEGFNYLYAGQIKPEMLALGLHTLTDELQIAVAAVHPPWQGATEALALYELCQAALQVSAVPQITNLLQTLRVSKTLRVLPFLADLAAALAKLQPIGTALCTYEQASLPEEKQFYLVQALDGLSRLEREFRVTLAQPEQNLLTRISAAWVAVITSALQSLQSRAQPELRLKTRQLLPLAQTNLSLELHNSGRSPAFNLTVTLLPGQDFTASESVVQLDLLPPGRTTLIAFPITITALVERVRVEFSLTFDDHEQSGKTLARADWVQVLRPNADFRPIPNPYAPGTPLRLGSPIFFGREDLFQFISENMAGVSRQNILVLIGQRRIGKTSFLQQLPARLGQEYLAVYVDGQLLGVDPGMANFFYDLALAIGDALAERGIKLSWPVLADFEQRPGGTFEREFLPAVLEAIGSRQLLLLFDEFEELEMRVASGRLEPTIFPYFRHLMQHQHRLGFIFVGAHRLESLSADYWSIFFNIALYKHVTFLDEAAARALVVEPVAESGLVYDDPALDKILRVTVGHPYFLQLICHALVNRANREQRSYLTLQDVNQVLGELVELGQAHFIFLWEQANSTERLILAALTDLLGQGSTVTAHEIAHLLAQRQMALELRETVEALRRLVERDILRQAPGQPPRYEYKLELVRLWVERYKPLAHVQN